LVFGDVCDGGGGVAVVVAVVAAAEGMSLEGDACALKMNHIKKVSHYNSKKIFSSPLSYLAIHKCIKHTY